MGVLIHVAAADGDLVREESAAIEAAMGRAMIRPRRREEMRPQLNDPQPLEELLSQLSPAALRVVLRDGMIIAAVDGDYHPAELEVLREIARVGEVPGEELDALFSWVEEGWLWMARGRGLLGVELPGDAALLD